MPRKKPDVPRIEALQQDLALGLSLKRSQILTRKQFALEFGKSLKGISNEGSNVPAYYLADYGPHGLALYTRPDIDQWKGKDPNAKRGKLPWPAPMTNAAARREILIKWGGTTLADDRNEKG